jgi:hypothetical protein
LRRRPRGQRWPALECLTRGGERCFGFDQPANRRFAHHLLGGRIQYGFTLAALRRDPRAANKEPRLFGAAKLPASYPYSWGNCAGSQWNQQARHYPQIAFKSATYETFMEDCRGTRLTSGKSTK